MSKKSPAIGVRRTLDGKYINIGGNKIDSNSKIMLRNNPDAVQVNKRSDKEEEIILNYDDKKVRLVGFKKL